MCRLVTGEAPGDDCELTWARRAAARGLATKVRYLLPDPSLRTEPWLSARLAANRAAGLVCDVLDIRSLMTDLAAAAPRGIAFGLWDDAVCTWGGGEGGLRVSSRDGDLDRARRAIAILDRARPLDPAAAWRNSPEAYDDPLVAAAPLARRLAEALCGHDPFKGDRTRAWYHGVWPSLRVLDIVITPRDHAGFYFDAFAALPPRSEPLRVLVSGSADHAMPALVLAACQVVGIAPEITVIDLCQTPLAMAAWFGRRHGATIRGVATDIQDATDVFGDGSFDLVCTHSFLGYFDDDKRRRLIEIWRHLLTPGGTVFTVNRVRPGAGDAPLSFTVEQAEAFRRRVLSEAGHWRAALDMTPEALADAARIYAEGFRIRPVHDLGQIRALFENGGFAVTRLDARPVETKAGRSPSGPTAPGGADYARVVAVRK